MNSLESKALEHYICNSLGDDEIDNYIIDGISYLNDIRKDVMEIWLISNRDDEHPFCSLSRLAQILKMDLAEMRRVMNNL